MKKNNYIDELFQNLISFIKERDFDQLFNDIKNNYIYSYHKDPLKFNSLADFYNEQKLWGEIDIEKNQFELVKNNAEALFNHCDDYEWLYHQLEDYRSKKILLTVLLFWIMLNDDRVKLLKDDVYSQYFDLDLINCDENEIFVDVGAYVGDTLVDYIKNFGKDCYQKIFCYEIMPTNVNYIKTNIKNFDLKNVVIKEKGASNQKGKMFIEDDILSSTGKLTDKGNLVVNTVSIDNDIKGPVTFIKMDIEGGEIDALEGLKNKITKYKPKLAICVYHNNEHLWKIPKLIHELNPDYKFYLRYYGGPLLPTEYILYAI